VEKRKQLRKECNHKVNFSLNSFQSFSAAILNLSKDGAFLETNKKIPIGKKLKLTIPFTSGKKIHTINGQIVHTGIKGVGIRFIKNTKKKLFKFF